MPLIAVLGFGVAACGGGETLSKEAFVKRADALCKQYKARAKAVERPKDIQDSADVAQYLDEVTPILKEGLAKLKALKPPEDVQSDWDDYIDQLKTGTRLLDSAAEKAETGGRYVGDLVKLQGASGKAEVAAGKAGAKGCEAAER